MPEPRGKPEPESRSVPLLIQGLVSELPPRGKPFPPKARERWLEALRVNLDLIYGDEDEGSDRA